MKTNEIKISTEFIKLDQLLKFSGIADSGAMAKDMIFSGAVEFNGEKCEMRGKKVRPGDKIHVMCEPEEILLEII